MYTSMYVYIREGNGHPFQCSCLENPMDGGAWQAAVHGAAKSRTRLSDFTFTFHFHALEKEMATHSSVLAQRTPGMGQPITVVSYFSGCLEVSSHVFGQSVFLCDSHSPCWIRHLFCLTYQLPNFFLRFPHLTLVHNIFLANVCFYLLVDFSTRRIKLKFLSTVWKNLHNLTATGVRSLIFFDFISYSTCELNL